MLRMLASCLQPERDDCHFPEDEPVLCLARQRVQHVCLQAGHRACALRAHGASVPTEPGWLHGACARYLLRHIPQRGSSARTALGNLRMVPRPRPRVALVRWGLAHHRRRRWHHEGKRDRQALGAVPHVLLGARSGQLLLPALSLLGERIHAWLPEQRLV